MNYNSRIARHGRNIMKYHEISAWCILTVPIQSIHGNSAYSHGNSVKNPATYHLIFVQRKKTFFQIPNSSNKISKSLAIFDLFPQTAATKFSTCDRLTSLSCHRPPFSSPCWTFPRVPSAARSGSRQPVLLPSVKKRSPPQSRCPKRCSKKVPSSKLTWQ